MLIWPQRSREMRTREQQEEEMRQRGQSQKKERGRKRNSVMSQKPQKEEFQRKMVSIIKCYKAKHTKSWEQTFIINLGSYLREFSPNTAMNGHPGLAVMLGKALQCTAQHTVRCTYSGLPGNQEGKWPWPSAARQRFLAVKYKSSVPGLHSHLPLSCSQSLVYL